MIELFSALFGLAFGSFIPVYAQAVNQNRLPLGRSRCDHCRKQLHLRSLIPVLSWFIQRGKSACCHRPLSTRYVYIELFTAATCVLVAQFTKEYGMYSMVLHQLLAVSMVAILLTDSWYHLIPDSALVVASASIIGIAGLYNASDAVILMGIVYGVYRLTNRKGIGLGDVKFMIPLGLLLGLRDGLLALYIAVVLGGLWGIVLIATGKKGLKSAIAFGPFLIAGLVVVLVWGEWIWKLVGMVYS